MSSFPISTLKERIEARRKDLLARLAEESNIGLDQGPAQLIRHLQGMIGALEWAQREIKELEEDASRLTFAVNPEAPNA